MLEQTEFLKDKINHAQKILVGIGEEFTDAGFEQSDIYKQYVEKKKDDKQAWLLPFLKAYYLHTREADNRLKMAYEKLAGLLKDKDYFVITLQNDDRILQTEMNPERIVSPRGSCYYMQCVDNCNHTVVDAQQEMVRIVKELTGKKELDEITVPVCETCGKEMVLNLHPQKAYCEAGYLKQWQKYQQWFGETLNRETLFIEAGAGFDYPGIIRWPFEKAVYLNQKAFLCRIHEEFWQLSKEIGEKGCSVKEKSVKFLANL